MYRPSVDFVDRSNKNAEKHYKENKCQGENCRSINLPTEAQATYSKRVYGKILCWDCQRKEVDKR